jgi:SAM-dependent methyltransferase
MGAGKLADVISGLANVSLKHKTDLKLLEAGCGSASYFDFANVTQSVGIDISQEQLNHNTFVQEGILGDIQTYPLAREEFDIVVCWDVLEHLSRPREALLNLFNSVKPGGLLILGFPNLLSFKGLITKITPLWIHEQFYHYLGYTSRPFRTYLRMAILPGKVIDVAQRNSFVVIFKTIIGGGVTTRLLKEGNWLIRNLFSVMNTVFRVASFGRCQSLYLDYCALVLKKQGE